MLLKKVKKFNTVLLIFFAFIFMFNDIVYASKTVENTNERYFIYDTKAYLENYEKLLDKAVEVAPTLELSIDDEMALQKAKARKLTYVSYPGILSLGEDSPNIEQFNLDFIERVLGVEIEFKTCADFGLPNSFDSIEILLDSKIADFAGFYSYGTEINRELESKYYATDSYSRQNVYQVSKNKVGEFDLYKDNIVIDPNILQVNNYALVRSNLVHSSSVEESLNLVKQNVVDYYIAEAIVVPYVTFNTDFLYTPVENKSFLPSLEMIASESEYENLINIINSLYTGQVLEVFYEATDDAIARNRYVFFSESNKNADFGNLKYMDAIKVGVFESKGIVEKNEKGEWQGYTIDYLDEVSHITGLKFKIIDYTDKSMSTMIGDLATGEIDAIFALPYELKEKYKTYLDDVSVDLYFTKPYFNKKLNILKKSNTTALNDTSDIAIADIGYDIHNEIIVEDFMSDVYGGLENSYLKSYQNSSLMYDALKEDKVRYTIGLPGEKVSLLRNEEDWVEYAFDYESGIDINSYNFSFVLASSNANSAEIYTLLNKVINTIYENEESVWFLESANYEEIVNLSGINSFLVYFIFIFLLIAIAITVVIYIRTKKANKSIYELIKVDKVSGLGNRFAFFDSVSLNEQEYFCIIISISNKKSFFEAIGKWNITPLLRSVGSRMVTLSTDVNFNAYRLSGEEFVLLVEHVETDRFKKFLALLIASITMPYPLGDNTLNITFNVGVCESKYAGRDVKKMILYAKNMVNVHEEHPELEYVMFTDKDKSDIEEVELIEELLNNDLSKCIVPYFQPIIDKDERKIIGVEVLARLWANGSIFSADKFIEIAEKNDKIANIDLLMIEEAVRYRDSLLDRKLIDKDFYFSINVSFDTIRRIERSTFVSLKYLNNVLSLGYIQMEVQECYLSTPEAQKFFNILKEENIRIAVDDFSIGHSSLAIIIERDFDAIKIEKNLLLAGLDETNKQLYTSLVDMLQAIGQNVVAVGVETEEHHMFTKDININAKEGFYYNKGLSASELVKYLTDSELSILNRRE